MLSALAKIVATYRIPCDVSLENHMACGFGACFSCVAPIRQDDGSSTFDGFALRGRSYRPNALTGQRWPIEAAPQVGDYPQSDLEPCDHSLAWAWIWSRSLAARS